MGSLGKMGVPSGIAQTSHENLKLRRYSIKSSLKPFFAKSLAASAEDITLVKGAIAEVEGLPITGLTLQIKEKSDGPLMNLAAELESF